MSRLRAVLVLLSTLSCAGSMQGDGGDTTFAVEQDAGVCTELSGVVTTLARGTYCVTGDVIIPTGVTLDIPAMKVVPALPLRQRPGGA